MATTFFAFSSSFIVMLPVPAQGTPVASTDVLTLNGTFAGTCLGPTQRTWTNLKHNVSAFDSSLVYNGLDNHWVLQDMLAL
jgi:hypothetical protein